MIAFFVVMGVIFTSLLVAGGIFWITAWLCDPLDAALWRALGRGSRSDILQRPEER